MACYRCLGSTFFLSFFRASSEVDALHRKTREVGMYWFRLASEYDR